MQRIVDAEYRMSRVSGDNPLITALPPQLGRDELYNALAREYTLPDDYKSYTPQERQELSVRIKQIYVPMEYSADIYASLFYGFLTAYTGRTALSITKRMNEIGQAIERKSCDALPDSPFIAESFAILGEPGSGKSTTIRNILRMYPMAIRHTKFHGADFNMIQIPYILIECPVNYSEKSVCYQILEKIDAILETNFMAETLRNTLSLDLLIIKIAQLCMRFSIGAILIDEIQNVLRTNTKNPSAGNSLIKFLVSLANKTGVCLVCIGTSAISDFFNAEAHLARRTRGPRIPLLSKGATYRIVLEKMWSNIAVLRPVPLSKEIEEEVYIHTGGCIGKMASLLHYAAFESIFFSRETVDVETIRSSAKKHDISARRPTLDPADIRMFTPFSPGNTQPPKKETAYVENIEEKTISQTSKRGRPKAHRDDKDILLAYAYCNELGLSLGQKLEEMELRYFGAC